MFPQFWKQSMFIFFGNLLQKKKKKKLQDKQIKHIFLHASVAQNKESKTVFISIFLVHMKTYKLKGAIV